MLFPTMLYPYLMLLSGPFYQALCDYQSTDASIIHPPWCITVQASGHTFAPNSEPFFPKLIFDTKNLLFPATVPGCPVYRTAVLKNTGDTPILFNFSCDPSEYVLHKLIPRPCGRKKIFLLPHGLGTWLLFYNPMSNLHNVVEELCLLLSVGPSL